MVKPQVAFFETIRSMNILRITLGVGLVLMLGMVVVLAVLQTSSASLLSVIHEIRPGMTQQKVEQVMGGVPNVFPASEPPGWIQSHVGPRDSGEYWHYFFGGVPPRNLLIYADDGQVVFVTWDPT